MTVDCNVRPGEAFASVLDVPLHCPMTDSGGRVADKRTCACSKEVLKRRHSVLINPATELCLLCGRPAYPAVGGGWHHERHAPGSKA